MLIASKQAKTDGPLGCCYSWNAVYKNGLEIIKTQFFVSNIKFSNAAMGHFKGKGGCEQTLLRTLLDTLESGDLLLGDAFYGTYFLLAELQSRQVDALFEQYGSRKRSTDFSQGVKLGYRDHLITLTKPKVRPDWMTAEQYVAAPESLVIRELEVGGKLLITSLTCPVSIPKQALKTLYISRWQVELDILEHQNHAGHGNLELQNPADGRKGDVGLSAGLQSDSSADGAISMAGRYTATNDQLQAYTPALARLAANG